MRFNRHPLADVVEAAAEKLRKELERERLRDAEEASYPSRQYVTINA